MEKITKRFYIELGISEKDILAINKEIKNGNKDVKNIAQVFDVSEESVWWRLRECNLIGKM